MIMTIADMIEENDFSLLINSTNEQLKMYGGARYVFLQLQREGVPVETRQEIAESMFGTKPDILKSIQLFMD